VVWIAAATLALLACDALLVRRDEERMRRRLLLLSALAGAALALAAWRARAALGAEAATVTGGPLHENAELLGFLLAASLIWAAGAACFLLPRCASLFPARLLCGPRLAISVAQAVGLLLRGFAAGEWNLLRLNWFVVGHLAVSVVALAFGLLALAIYFLYGHALLRSDPPQA